MTCIRCGRYNACQERLVVVLREWEYGASADGELTSTYPRQAAI